MSKFNLEFRETVKTGGNRLSQLIDNPFRQFAASKMSQAVKPMTIVEYTDLLGTVHRIPVRNRTQMREVQLYLSIFKAEAATVKSIISEYPMTYGRVPKRFLSELKRELKAVGVDSKFAMKLAGY